MDGINRKRKFASDLFIRDRYVRVDMYAQCGKSVVVRLNLREVANLLGVYVISDVGNKDTRNFFDEIN